MRLAWWIAALLVLSSGCLSGSTPAPEPQDADDEEGRVAREGDDAPEIDGPSGGPEVATTRTYSGRIVLRGASNGGPTYISEGDPAHFCFKLPTNVTLMRGVFSFSPYQQAGLQFRSKFSSYGSWGPAGETAPQSPIVVEVPEPEDGEWFTYGGPGIVGGMMDWTYDLTMVTKGLPSAKAVAAFEDIDDSC